MAKKDLPAGLILKPGHLRWQSWPKEALAPSYIARGTGKIADLAGAVVRSGLAAGEPVTTRRVVKPGDRGFLAAVLTPGKRAVSVPVTATSGIAGFVFPGDRIDLILTHGIERESKVRKIRQASETVLTDIRVVAVDQHTDDQNGKVSIAKTATLEVMPKQAEIVALAMNLGKLSLSLRSIGRLDAAADDSAVKPKPKPVARKPRGRGYTWDSEVSFLLQPPFSRDGVHRVQLVRGGKAEEIEIPRPAR